MLVFVRMEKRQEKGERIQLADPRKVNLVTVRATTKTVCVTRRNLNIFYPLRATLHKLVKLVTLVALKRLPNLIITLCFLNCIK